MEGRKENIMAEEERDEEQKKKRHTAETVIKDKTEVKITGTSRCKNTRERWMGEGKKYQCNGNRRWRRKRRCRNNNKYRKVIKWRSQVVRKKKKKITLKHVFITFGTPSFQSAKVLEYACFTNALFNILINGSLPPVVSFASHHTIMSRVT